MPNHNLMRSLALYRSYALTGMFPSHIPSVGLTVLLKNDTRWSVLGILVSSGSISTSTGRAIPMSSPERYCRHEIFEKQFAPLQVPFRTL